MTNSEKPVELHSPGETNWTDSAWGRVVAGSILVAETPFVNEAIKFAVLAYAIKTSNHDPVIGALAFGAATLVTESSAAVVAADVLDSNGGKQLTVKLNNYLEEKHVAKHLKTTLPTEVALAAFSGSAIAVAAKHRQDPERSRLVNRRYGVASALGLTAMCAVQGYGITVGAEHYTSPVTWGAAVLGVGATVGAWKWAKDKVTRSPEVEHKDVNRGESPQALGLSPEDSVDVLNDERTVFVEENGKKVPVLVPIDRLYWYNTKYLREHFDTDDIYYYAHPDLKSNEIREVAYNNVTEVTERGGVVLYDTVTSNDTVYGDLDHELLESGRDHNMVPITKDGRQRFLYQYDGKFVTRRGLSKEFKKTDSIHDTYKQAIARGNIAEDPQTGPALKDVIDGDEAERLWDIYKKPFEKLSDEHPINSAYDKEGFMDILKDPEAVKAIYREKGEITTLAFFVNSLDHCSWLDASYYKSEYPEAVETGNHFIFPGIVTDELKRGASYSVPLMQLIAKVQAKRDTGAIISFECTDISYKYIPRIVRFSIAKSGVARTKGFKHPVSRLDYHAIKK